MITGSKLPLLGLVGPCASGKSTIRRLLEMRGFLVRHIAQEHSYVPTMWQKLSHPDVLIFLDASYPTTIRRKNLGWSEAEYLEQHRRLQHAREHADLYIFTDPLTPDQIADLICEFLQNNGISIPPSPEQE